MKRFRKTSFVLALGVAGALFAVPASAAEGVELDQESQALLTEVRAITHEAITLDCKGDDFCSDNADRRSNMLVDGLKGQYENVYAEAAKRCERLYPGFRFDRVKEEFGVDPEAYFTPAQARSFETKTFLEPVRGAAEGTERGTVTVNTFGSHANVNHFCDRYKRDQAQQVIRKALDGANGTLEAVRKNAADKARGDGAVALIDGVLRTVGLTFEDLVDLIHGLSDLAFGTVDSGADAPADAPDLSDDGFVPDVLSK